MAETKKDYVAIPCDENCTVEADDDPHCDIYRKENLAITMAYLSVGLVGSMILTPLNVYLVGTLNAEPPIQNTITMLQTLPWSLKLIFGFISDAFPICGMQRKPYLTIGALLYSFAFISYGIAGEDNVVLLALCVFMGTLGLIQMDVMADTMCVQRSKFEPEDSRGQMQATFYSIRFAGGLVGAVLGATLCNRHAWGWGLSFHQVALLMGMIPFVLVVPWLPTLRERFRVIGSPQLALVAIGSSSRSNSMKRGNSSVVNSPKPAAKSSNSNNKVGNSSTESSSIISNSQYHQHYHTNDNNSDDVVSSMELGGNASSNKSSGHWHVNAIDSFNSNNNKITAAATPITTATATASTAVSGSLMGHSHSHTHLHEIDEDDVEPLVESKMPTISEQLHQIWRTVQLRSVWRPMIFVFTFNLFQVPNVAWQSYLQLSLHFPPWILGLTVVLGSFMTFAGILVYKNFFFKTCWRKIYLMTVALTTFFSLTQLILIFQINTTYLHMSNYFFALGDDVISSYISGIQFLPVCIMYMRLCPDGAEGASYSMLTTFGNIALVCASNLGNHLSNIWDVSNSAMRHNNIDGLWKLNLLTSCLALLPLCWLHLLPRSPEEQEQLAKSQDRSPVAGVVFLLVLFGALTWTASSAIMKVLA